MKARWLQTLVAFCLPPLVGAGVCVALVGMLKQNELFSSPVKLPTADVGEVVKKPLNPVGGELRPAKAVDASFPPVASIKPPQPVDVPTLKKLEAVPPPAMPAASAPKAPVASQPLEDKPAPDLGFNYQMYASGYAYNVKVEGLPSDVVRGAGMGDLVNRFKGIHTAYYFIFQRATK